MVFVVGNVVELYEVIVVLCGGCGVLCDLMLVLCDVCFVLGGLSGVV